VKLALLLGLIGSVALTGCAAGSEDLADSPDAETVAKAESSLVTYGSDANYLNPGTYCSDYNLYSPNRTYNFVMQSDGNVVLYKTTPSYHAIWASNTWKGWSTIPGVADVCCDVGYNWGLHCFRKQYNVSPVQYSDSFKVPQSTGQYLSVQSDGNVVLYDSSWRAVWATNTWGK
jgi:hypothetical protein